MDKPTPVESQNIMIAAVEELFDEVESTVTLTDGRKVEIRAAKVKNIRQITEFIQRFVMNFEPDALVSMLGMVSRKQEAKLREGESPYLLDTAQMVKDVAGETSLVLQVVNHGLEALQEFVPMFTDMEAAEFEELDLDDAAVVAFAVFGRNYHFFTRRVLPVLRGSIVQRSQQAGKARKPKSAES